MCLEDRDVVKVTVMEARLDVDQLDDALEEYPGAFVGVGGQKLMRIRKPLPQNLPDGGTLTLSWTNADKVEVRHRLPGTAQHVPITSPQEYGIADLIDEGNQTRCLYVNGLQGNDELRDVVFTLEFEIADAAAKDVVKFTVIEADLDIVGLEDEDEAEPGGLVVCRRDGNNAPRRQIVLNRVEAWFWKAYVMHLPLGWALVEGTGAANTLPPAQTIQYPTWNANAKKILETWVMQ